MQKAKKKQLSVFNFIYSTDEAIEVKRKLIGPIVVKSSSKKPLEGFVSFPSFILKEESFGFELLVGQKFTL